MRIAVDEGGFTDAAEACRSGNQIVAMVTESLSGKLAGCAGMAGDDFTSADFAASYDDAARESMLTLVELTDAFAGIGRLLAASGDNHGRAEAASAGTPRGSYRSVSDDDFVQVEATTPPSSLGATPPTLGAIEQWILDRVEGFVWPTADVGQLEDAAVAWRRTSDAVAALDAHCDLALRSLEWQHSPEVPLARDALEELRTLILDTAEELLAVASCCEEYAAAVREAHERTRALISEIGKMVVEGVAISALAGAFTGGLGAGAAGSAAVARIAAKAPRFHAVLFTLRTTATGATRRLQRARQGIASVRARAEKFARARARSERGSISLPGRAARWKPGWLKAHEAPPGHTISDHVGKTVRELAERCRIKGLKESSSFSSEEAAESFIERIVGSRESEIASWLDSGAQKALPLDAEFGVKTGITVTKQGAVTQQTSARVVLIPNKSMPGGWQILTAYPI